MRRGLLLLTAVSISAATATLGGQDTGTVAARLGHADVVLYNGTIVTVDDPSFNASAGTVHQALAIRGTRILATGTTRDMRALAGPRTRQIDLKGRTVLPSLILTHEHPTDWIWMDPEALKRAIPAENDYLRVRFLQGTAEQQIAGWQQALREEVSRAKPGQWILLSTYYGSNYEHMPGLTRSRWYGDITREQLDAIAPDNPVRFKNNWIAGHLNTRAIEEIKRLVPDADLSGVRNRAEDGRQLEPDIMLAGRLDVLAELLRAEMELWAAHGITAFGSSPYTPESFKALSQLDREGRMPGRFAWSYSGPDFHIDTLKYIAGLLGNGTDYLWNIGAQGWWSGGSCTTLPAPVEIKAREDCAFEPGGPGRQTLEDIVRVGGRIAAMHSGGDKDIDYLFDAIEKASKEAGFTADQIRAKRHAFDHASGAPRPDQHPRIKRLGMMVSMINTVLWENRTDYDVSFRVKAYGLEAANWTVPRKSVTDAEIMNTAEIDRPLPHKIFYNVWVGMTRFNEGEGRAFAPQQGTDRIVQLKSMTTWGAYYLLREQAMGSLEPGKLADLIVLDRDYLTVPVDDIPKIRVLLTMVGGKIVHLWPDLAQELGTDPVGPVTWPSRPFEGHYAR
jgi:predicted amidohydrolase YtcJ